MGNVTLISADPTLAVLLYFVIPLWLLAGTADWLCHLRQEIAHTAGAKESVLHLLMFGEIGVPLVACLFLEINALVFAAIIGAFLAHEATALWDVSYATRHRTVTPVEQHIHSFLEILPLTAAILLAVRHWPQFLAVFGLGDEAPRWNLALKSPPLPMNYLLAILGAAVLLAFLPYVQELWRGIQASREARLNRRVSVQDIRHAGQHSGQYAGHRSGHPHLPLPGHHHHPPSGHAH
jgi:hypothetical protein